MYVCVWMHLYVYYVLHYVTFFLFFFPSFFVSCSHGPCFFILSWQCKVYYNKTYQSFILKNLKFILLYVFEVSCICVFLYYNKLSQNWAGFCFFRFYLFHYNKIKNLGRVLQWCVRNEWKWSRMVSWFVFN